MVEFTEQKKAQVNDMKNNSARSAMLILLAGALWGTMGIFVRRFYSFGFDAMQVASMRLTAGAVIFIIVLALRGGRGFKIAVRDIPLFLGLGLGSVLFFTVCYFKSIEMLPLSIAAILLYTSPIWVTLMSVLFFKERLTLRRVAALVLAFGGCVLVSGLGGGGLTPLGLLIGLCSGIGYGLYSILGSVALRKYEPLTVTTYAFLFSAAGSWFICRPAEMLSIASSLPPLSFALDVLSIAVVTAVAQYLLYTLGLKNTPASKAAIMATVEPLVATVLGIVVFSEPLTPAAAAGIILILAAIVLLNARGKK